MERRRYIRTGTALKADIIIRDARHTGYVENLSADGIGYFMSYFLRIPGDFSPVKHVQLRLFLSSEKQIELRCELVWFSRTMVNSERLTLGLRIIDPPQDYIDYIENLQSRTGSAESSTPSLS